ncbi:MAG: oxygen-independent coproporphyrinogen III oxidase-like protein [Nitrosomonadales bacterium]|nr:oxygen-independent coproporphyrinogen III oxidase-like protein [Nitrosomonadales bacterium]
MTTHFLHPVGLKAQAVNFRALPPLSLYIHVPWCVRKCPYCDFNSHEAKSELPQREYVAALIRDLELALPQIWGRKVYSVFIGGGTPSLLSVESMAKILTAVRMLLPLDVNAEITLEANPGTVETEKFAGFLDAGVNRLSLGIQSFSDAQLNALGRIHDAEEARRAVRVAQRYFDNINLDLMYGLPQQTLEQAEQDVRTALEFSPQHLSCYHLTLEPNTLFAHQPPPLPDDDASHAMQLCIEELLDAHGYLHYETSAFAQPKKQSRHNLHYWQFGDYLGIGAGAHSKLSFPDKVVRQARHKQPQAYLDAVAQGAPIQEARELTRNDLAFEFMMNALRLNEGFATELFTERTSLPLLLIRRELEEAERRGLLSHDQQHIAPTELGRRFLNDLLEIFLRE